MIETKRRRSLLKGLYDSLNIELRKQQLWEKARIVQLQETKFQKRPCTEASSKTWPRGSWRNSALKRRAKSKNRICRTLVWKEFCHPQALWQLKHMEAITFVSCSNPFPISPAIMVSPREALAASLSPTEIVAKGLSACSKVFLEKDFVNFKTVPERNAWSIFWKLEPSDIHWHKDSRDNTGRVYNTIKRCVHWTRVLLGIGISWNMEIFSLLLPGNFSAPKARDKEGFPQKSCVTFGEVGEQSPRTEDLSILFGCLCLKKDFYMVKLKLKKCWDFFTTWFVTSIYGVFFSLTKMPIFWGSSLTCCCYRWCRPSVGMEVLPPKDSHGAQS